jgi:hypothetical protein
MLTVVMSMTNAGIKKVLLKDDNFIISLVGYNVVVDMQILLHTKKNSHYSFIKIGALAKAFHKRR